MKTKTLNPVAVAEGNQVGTARLIALKGAVKLEAVGMRHSSGRSMRKVAALELGLRPNTGHDAVIGALNKEIDRRLALGNAAAATLRSMLEGDRWDANIMIARTTDIRSPREYECFKQGAV